jgi:inorganic triphosphatase YgiF
MSAPREIELKFEVPANGLSRLGRSPLLKGATARSRKHASLVSVYFDTDKLKLRNKGLSLRVRRIGPTRLQTIKQEAVQNGALFDRNEWEREIPGTEPDFDAARDTALEPLLSKKLRRALRPVFKTRVQRTVYPVESNGSEIELAIDQGRVEAGRQSEPLCEMELELKRGETAELFRIARELAAEIPVQLAVKSKAERGYALIAGEKVKAIKSVPVVLGPDMPRQAAFGAIARSCLHQLAANRRPVEAGDPEGVHQMRVGLRRMRAAISLFSEMLAGPQTDAVKAEFKWLAGELAPARELDVFINQVLEPVSRGKPNGPGLSLLARDFRKRREMAFARAMAAVESARFRALVLDGAAWIEAGEWTRRGDERLRALRERSLAPAAAKDLHRRRKKLLKRGKHIDTLDPKRRHKLRIQTKKLRYASEFFAGAFPGKKSARRRQKIVTSLEKLQDALGDLNDIAVHAGLTERLVNGPDEGGERSRRASEAFAAGRLSGREEARIAAVLADAQRAYAAFAREKPFWS